MKNKKNLTHVVSAVMWVHDGKKNLGTYNRSRKGLGIAEVYDEVIGYRAKRVRMKTAHTHTHEAINIHTHIHLRVIIL